MRADFLRRSGRYAQQGFTLLEMLVVMVIIGLLAGLVGPRIFGKVDSARVQTAQTQIKMLESSLNIMRLDVGRLPPPESGLQWLINPPGDESFKPLWRGPYIEGVLPLDPWANPYQYKVPGVNGKPFAIYSLGADGKEGGDGLNADVGLN